jgi:hypothetical protein
MSMSEKTDPQSAAASRPAPDASNAAAGHDAAPTLDELYTDLEVLKRIGAVIATAALRATSAKY